MQDYTHFYSSFQPFEIPFSSQEIKFEVLDAQKKTTVVAARLFKSSFFLPKWLLHLKYKEVLVNPMDRNQVLYVKIKDLTKKLGLTNQELKGNVRQILITRVMQARRQKIADQIQHSFRLNADVTDHIKQLIQPHHCTSVLDALIHTPHLYPILRSYSFVLPHGFLKTILENDQSYQALCKLQPYISNDGLKGISDQPIFNQYPEEMAQTLIHIAQHIKHPTGLYVKKDKNNHIPFGYMITDQKQIYIRYKEIGKGAVKKVQDLIYLNQAHLPMVHVSIKARNASDLEKEQAILLALQGAPHILPPFKNKFKVPTKDGHFKAVATNIKLTGDGSILKHASLYHVACAFHDAAIGLTHMHQKGFIHCDFKPWNLLIEGDLKNSQQRLNGYVHDFGLTVKVGEGMGFGTAEFIPPEIVFAQEKAYAEFIDQKIQKVVSQEGVPIVSINQDEEEIIYKEATKDITTDKIDSWSLGASILFILDSSLLAKVVKAVNSEDSEEEMQKAIYHIINGTIAEVKKKDFFLTKEERARIRLLELTKRLLVVDYTKRLSCAEAARHLNKMMTKF